MHPVIFGARRRILLAIVGALVIACSASVASEESDPIGTASVCLLRNQYEPCGAFTESLVRSVLSDLGATKITRQSFSKPPSAVPEGHHPVPPINLNSCSYTWSSTMNRSITLPGGSTIDVPRDAEVRLGGIIEYAETPVVEFERTHRRPTAEEQKALNAMLTENLREAEAEGKISEAGRSMGQQLASSVSEGIKYSDVKGLGRAARWESRFSQLSLLIDSVKVDVHASVSENDDKNRETAQALAAALLETCR